METMKINIVRGFALFLLFSLFLINVDALSFRLVTSDTHGDTGCVGYTDDEYDIFFNFIIFLIIDIIPCYY